MVRKYSRTVEIVFVQKTSFSKRILRRHRRFSFDEHIVALKKMVSTSLGKKKERLRQSRRALASK